jgi:hypothetical protein
MSRVRVADRREARSKAMNYTKLPSLTADLEAEIRQAFQDSSEGKFLERDAVRGLLAELDHLRAENAALVERLAAAERATPPQEPVEHEWSMHINGSHLMPVETLQALGEVGRMVKEAYEAGWRPGDPGPIEPPASSEAARGEGEG